MKKIWGYSVLHLFIDFFSIYTLFYYSHSIDNFVMWGFIYNMIAFFTQPIVGAILDKTKHGFEISLISSVLMAVSSLIPVYFISIPLVGIFNSVYHVSAGNEVMQHTKKSWPLGVFISFGALGLGLGYTFTRNIVLFISFLVIFLFVILLTYSYRDDEDKINFDEGYKEKKIDFKTLILPIILILLAVGLRGFFGQYSDNAQFENYNFLIISVVVFIGKFIGGFIFDHAKGYVLFLLSLLLSVLGIVFRTNVILMLLGFLGSNLLMAFTLDGIRRAMPNHKALGFGFVASFLLFGTLVGSYFIQNFEYVSMVGYILSVVNILFAIVIYILINRKGRYV